MGLKPISVQEVKSTVKFDAVYKRSTCLVTSRDLDLMRSIYAVLSNAYHFELSNATRIFLVFLRLPFTA